MTTVVKASKKVSPKVWAGLITGLGIAVVGAVLAYVTPATFDFLGQWGPLAYALVTIGGAQIAAYLKKDPLRSDVSAKEEADIQGVVDDVAPVVEATFTNGPVAADAAAAAPATEAGILGVVGDVRAAE